MPSPDELRKEMREAIGDGIDSFMYLAIMNLERGITKDLPNSEAQFERLREALMGEPVPFIGSRLRIADTLAYFIAAILIGEAVENVYSLNITMNPREKEELALKLEEYMRDIVIDTLTKKMSKIHKEEIIPHFYEDKPTRYTQRTL